jgi:mannose-6-phosphate isomerase-like protein (cupin superfamily)
MHGQMTDNERASAYVMGLLDQEARAQCRLRVIEDASFATLVGDWERRLAPLALTEEAEVPDGLLQFIEARIAKTGIEVPGTVTVRAGAGDWIEVSPGLKIKIMNRVEAINRQTFMAWLQPGAEYSDHDHDQDEEIYMIEGDLIIGELVLKAGDFHVARAGRHHPVHRTTAGCLCLISQAISPV